MQIGSCAWMFLAEISSNRTLHAAKARAAEANFTLFCVIAGLVLTVSAVAGIVWFFFREERQSNYNDANALFRSLCYAHALTARDRTLLRQLASCRRLQRPAELFLKPECFETTNLPPELSARRDWLEEIRSKLFLVPQSTSGSV